MSSRRNYPGKGEEMQTRPNTEKWGSQHVNPAETAIEKAATLQRRRGGMGSLSEIWT